MKKKIHPKYQEVLFIDSSTGDKFLCGTTLQPEETSEFEGKKYPAYWVPVSSASHPFFTGRGQFIDTEGRVNKFTKRYQAKKEQVQKAKKIGEKAQMASKTAKKAKSKTASKSKGKSVKSSSKK